MTQASQHNPHPSKYKQRRRNAILILTVALIGIWGSSHIDTQPIRAFGGAVWLDNGLQYMSDGQISDRIEKIIAPAELKIVDTIISTTPSCENVESGFCQREPSTYAYKELVTPAVAYKPGTPDTKRVTGYCTLCNDGTFSPSCAVGRGACSYHGGVAAYGVERYVIIPGTREVAAQPAEYSYNPKSYLDSPNYIKPSEPSLNTVASFVN
jgi:hypothetical protein